MVECKIQGCENPSKSKGLCNKHYQKAYRESQAEKGVKVEGMQPLHRGLMSQYLNRAMQPDEQVRLKSKQGRVETGNLEVWWKSGGPKSARVKDLVDFADAVLLRYGAERSKHGVRDYWEPPHFEVFYWEGDLKQHIPIWYFSAEQAERGWAIDPRSKEFPTYGIWNSLTGEITPGLKSRMSKQKRN